MSLTFSYSISDISYLMFEEKYIGCEYKERELCLMVKHMTFNHYYTSSNLVVLIFIINKIANLICYMSLNLIVFIFIVNEIANLMFD